jgi:hypothetical protein
MRFLFKLFPLWGTSSNALNVETPVHSSYVCCLYYQYDSRQTKQRLVWTSLAIYTELQLRR